MKNQNNVQESELYILLKRHYNFMKKIVLFVLVTILSSCSTMNNISGKQFLYESYNRKLVLSFQNDSLCTLTNTFHCNNIDEKYKEITVTTIYKRESNMIFLRNIDCKDNGCIFSPIFDVPIQESNNCNFLSRESRNFKKIFDGRKYQSEYLKYGAIPNVDIDTLYIHKKQITFIKKIESGTIGFIFK